MWVKSSHFLNPVPSSLRDMSVRTDRVCCMCFILSCSYITHGLVWSSPFSLPLHSFLDSISYPPPTTQYDFTSTTRLKLPKTVRNSPDQLIMFFNS